MRSERIEVELGLGFGSESAIRHACVAILARDRGYVHDAPIVPATATYVRYASTYEICQYMGDMSVHGRHASTWETCQYMGDMPVHGRYASVCWSS